eukprot:552319_1
MRTQTEPLVTLFVLLSCLTISRSVPSNQNPYSPKRELLTDSLSVDSSSDWSSLSPSSDDMDTESASSSFSADSSTDWSSLSPSSEYMDTDSASFSFDDDDSTSDDNDKSKNGFSQSKDKKSKEKKSKNGFSANARQRTNNEAGANNVNHSGDIKTVGEATGYSLMFIVFGALVVACAVLVCVYKKKHQGQKGQYEGVKKDDVDVLMDMDGITLNDTAEALAVVVNTNEDN